MNYALDVYAMYRDGEYGKEGMRPAHVHRFTDWKELEAGVFNLSLCRADVNEFMLALMNCLLVHPKVYFIHDVATFDDSYPYMSGAHNVFTSDIFSVSLPFGLTEATMHKKIDQWAKSNDCVYIVREISYSPTCVNIHAITLGHWANVNGVVRNLIIDEFLKESNGV